MLIFTLQNVAIDREEMKEEQEEELTVEIWKNSERVGIKERRKSWKTELSYDEYTDNALSVGKWYGEGEDWPPALICRG